jgi:hypothetical protein
MTSVRAHVEAEAIAALKYEPSARRSAEPGKPLASLDIAHLKLVPCAPYAMRLSEATCRKRWRAAQGKGVAGKHAMGSIDARSSACRYCEVGASRCGRAATKPRKLPTLRGCKVGGCDGPVNASRRVCDAHNLLAQTRDGHGVPRARGRDPHDSRGKR